MIDKTDEKDRDITLINIILSYALEHSMSFREVEKCLTEIKEVYLSDGLIKK